MERLPADGELDDDAVRSTELRSFGLHEKLQDRNLLVRARHSYSKTTSWTLHREEVHPQLLNCRHVVCGLLDSDKRVSGARGARHHRAISAHYATTAVERRDLRILRGRTQSMDDSLHHFRLLWSDRVCIRHRLGG